MNTHVVSYVISRCDLKGRWVLYGPVFFQDNHRVVLLMVHVVAHLVFSTQPLSGSLPTLFNILEDKLSCYQYPKTPPPAQTNRGSPELEYSQVTVRLFDNGEIRRHDQISRVYGATLPLCPTLGRKDVDQTLQKRLDYKSRCR